MIQQNMEQFVSTFSASGQPPKETCRQCRFRKVRCDGKHGEKGCGDCVRLKFDCSFVVAPGPTTPTSTTIHAATPTTTATTTTIAESIISSSLPSPTIEAGRVVERRRTSKACTHCRQQKIRCSGGAACLACKKKGLACVYGTDRRRSSRVATASSVAGTPTETAFPGHIEEEVSLSGAEDTSATSPTSAGTTSSEPGTVMQPRPGPLLLPPDIQALVEFYFNHVYPLPSYAFLHPQTIIRQCSEGTLETCLAYSISAVASHHSGSSHGRGDAELDWIQAAEDLIWKHLESPTIARLQALLLVVLYRLETGAFQRAFMLSSLAARGAAAMRLNYERTAPRDAAGRASRETRRRLVWSLKLVERYFSMGLPEFELCPVENVYLELPCWEEDFSTTTTMTTAGEAQPQRTLQTSDFGSYHLCVKLEMLRRDVVKLSRSLSIHDAPLPELPGVMRDFEQHLERLGRELPSGGGGLPGLAAERLAQLLHTPWLARQVLVHLSFHQCHCDLYRLLLRDYREAAPAVVLDALDPALLARAEELCLRHAAAIVDILATLNQQSQRAQLLEFDTAICGYHATRILLFIAQRSSSSSNRSTLASARPSEEWALSRAELCLASLRRFFPSSRLVRPVLEEMRRAMAVFSTRSATMTPSRLASPGPSASTAAVGSSISSKDPAAGLSAAARVRQRLAIHSLLRQADFADEDDDGRMGDANHQHVTSPGISSPSHPLCGGPLSSSAHDASGTSSSQSAPSPQTPGPCDGDLWQLSWFDGGDPIERWAPANKVHAPHPGFGGGGGVGGLPSSFSFPWLQREEAAASRGDGMA